MANYGERYLLETQGDLCDVAANVELSDEQDALQFFHVQAEQPSHHVHHLRVLAAQLAPLAVNILVHSNSKVQIQIQLDISIQLQFYEISISNQKKSQ